VRESCRAIGDVKGWTCESPSKDSAAQTSSTTRPNLPVEERENPAEKHKDRLKPTLQLLMSSKRKNPTPRKIILKKTLISRSDELKLPLKLIMKQKSPTKPVSVDELEADSTVNNIDIIEILSKIHGK
jgi:hypothetical protein